MRAPSTRSASWEQGRWASASPTSRPRCALFPSPLALAARGRELEADPPRASTCSQTAGVQVVLSDRSQQQLTKGLQFVDTLLGKEVKKGRMNNEEASRVRGRISAAGDSVEQGAFGEVDLVVEVRPTSVS